MSDFQTWFEEATGYQPYPFQCKLADGNGLGQPLPSLVDIPTGCGKTAAIILGWLWRRRFHPDPLIRQSTPKRLVYCLPMRVLVEQTRDCAVEWLEDLDMLAHSRTTTKEETPDLTDPPGLLPAADGGPRIAVHMLMGGEIENDWDRFPENDAVLIGTQDQLLSRALNRGYAMSRARWPMHFGLLNNDCLWVMDEIQLMDTGLATTLQMEAFRSGDGFGHYGNCKSIWMSATLDADWLQTVDHPKPHEPALSLSAAEKAGESSVIGKRLHAPKLLHAGTKSFENKRELAAEILGAHSIGTLTLAIFNAVERATEMYKEIEKCLPKQGNANLASPELVLLHSRFRPPDRKGKIDAVLSSGVPSAGRIVVSTQVVEAGVDISAKTLFTELAPWPSLVQRFGRCNRYGEYPQANIYWIDVAEKLAPPYKFAELLESRERLKAYEGKSMCPVNLPLVKTGYEHKHVIRRKDLVELFDTTPDLAGNDLDASRYIREGDEHDAQVFWRDLGKQAPSDNLKPGRDELCPAPIKQLNEFIKKKKCYRRNFLDGCWETVKVNPAYPGQIYLFDCSSGGYTTDRGWDGKEKKVVPVNNENEGAASSYDSDFHSQATDWLTIAEHTEDVCRELEKILSELGLDQAQVEILLLAARRHDWGKSHKIFQEALANDAAHVPGSWAKSPKRPSRYERKHFRHELASALAMMQADLPDLAAYLAAAHHGKVRLSIRSLPAEHLPGDNRRFARGIWDEDELPEVDLGGGISTPPVKLSLEPMELGLSADGKPSWAERMLKLRDDPNLGPFRLAFLETLLRAADWRASGKAHTLDAAEQAVEEASLEIMTEAEALKDGEITSNA